MEVKMRSKTKTKDVAPKYAFYRPPTKRLYRKLEGWLWKKGASAVIAGWKRRYFTLKDNRLYYSSTVHAEPINYILLTANTAVEPHPDPRFPYTFHLRTTYTKRVFVLAAEAPDDITRWVAGVREVIKLLIDRYSLHKDFIRQYVLPPEDDEQYTPDATESEASDAMKSKSDRERSKSLLNPLLSRPTQLLGPSSTRPLVDVQITHAHLNPHNKLAVAAGRAGLYLELSLGKQSLRTWPYQHQQSSSKAGSGGHTHVESIKESRRTDQQHSPVTSPRLRPHSIAPPSSSSSPSPTTSSFPWAGMGCTFTEEGSGDGVMDEGRVKLALYQIGGLGSADTLVDEQWIDLAPLAMGAAEEFTLAFSFSFDDSPPPERVVSPSQRSAASHNDNNASSSSPIRSPPFHSESPIAAVIKAETARNGHSDWAKAQVSPAARNGRRTTSPGGDVSQGGVICDHHRRATSPRVVDTTLADNWKAEMLGVFAVGDFATQSINQEEEGEEEKEGKKDDDDDDEEQRQKQAEQGTKEEEKIVPTSPQPKRDRSFTSSSEDATCTVTIRVQKSAGSFDKSGLLHDRGIAATSVPMRLDTGDVVLFDNSHIMAYGTKFFTMSQWDHVAMVVRWWNNELKLLEATLEDGVEVYNFDDRLEFLRTVSKVAVRQLSVQRTPEMIDGIYRFIDEVQGRPFQKNRIAMVKAWSGLNTEEDLSSLFCSELTAAAYKRMGLLKDESKTSNNYMPSCWAGKGRAEDTRVPLKPDVRLERRVVFPKL